MNSLMPAKGRYEILEILGEGGMGIVYRAIDPVLNREVAVKTIRDPQDKAALELFKRECAVLASITHPNIVEIFDVGETEEAGAKRPYFVMPLLPGITIQELIKTSSTRLTVERSIQIISQVCRGLQAAHDHDLVHRDLKPSNLFVLPDDSMKIIDFGMAHLTNLRSTTGLKGTVLYMAPEQLQLQQPTPLSDQFSLAVVAYEMLARRHPFRAAGQDDLWQAILHYTPPPVSEFNPLVGSSICQVIHKALAKQPFHRFSDIRTFSDCLHKALRGEPIDIFDPARVAPRLARARKALESGELDDAAERIKELESESFLAPEIDELRKEIEEVRRANTVKQLLETARRRFEEGEYVRALQKVQEVLNLEPGNTDAFTLKGAIESKRGATQIEDWFRLANQHMENHAYAHARQALEKLLDRRPREGRAKALLAEVERREQEHIRLQHEKEEAYQSASNAFQRGDVNSAFHKAELLLELDRRAPYSTSPEQGAKYQKFYEEVRSKRDQLASQEAEARRHLDSGDFAAAKAICDEVLQAYPNHVLFGALRDDVEQAQRLEISAYIAKIEKEVASEPDLNRKVAILEEASQKYPSEARFNESLRQVRSRRDLVDSIAGRARTAEEARQFSEALGFWEMLRGIYPKYPGLDIEIDRLHKRRAQQVRADTKDHWVTQIDQALAIRDYDKATSLAADALAEFPGDPEVLALAKQAQQAQTCASEAVEKANRGKDLYGAGNAPEALNLLREALQLDSQNPAVRAALVDILLKEAVPHIDTDWRTAEPLVQEALDLDPSNPGARSLNTLIQDKRQAEEVSAALSRARELQAQGNLKHAIAELDKLRQVYPRENRLIQLRSVLQERLSAKDREEIRARDGEELKERPRQFTETETITDYIRTNAPYQGTTSVVPSTTPYQGPTSVEPATTPHQGTPSVVPATAPYQSTPSVEPAKTPYQGTPSVEPSTTPYQGATSVVPSAATAAPQQTPPSPPPPPAPQPSGKKPKFLWPLAGAAAAALILFFVIHRLPKHAQPSLTKVQVAFRVNPEDATIWVDNQRVPGTTMQVSPGSHTVRVEKAGYIGVVQPFSDRDRTPIELNLAPAPHAIRIFADGVRNGQVLLDDAAIEPLQNGSYSHDLTADGNKHTLKLLDGKTQIFSVEFQADPGAAAHLLTLSSVTREDIPVMVVSNLGSQAFAYSNARGMRAGFKDSGELNPIPAEGLELALHDGANEVTFDDGKNQMPFAVESENAPVLSIRVGAATRGVLSITSNDGAHIFIDGQQRRSPVRISGWQDSLDPGEHTIKISLPGYDDFSQKIRIAAGKSTSIKVELSPSITTAYLAVSGGTPGAEVWLDGAPIGSLDSNGSMAPTSIKPDIDHSIQFKKQYFEDSAVLHRQAAVKQSLSISTEARLKAFGTLVFTTIEPPETELTIQGPGATKNAGAPQRVSDKTSATPLPAGAYTVRGTAGDQYSLYQQDVQISSGQQTSIQVRLGLREPKTSPKQEKKAPPPAQLTDLFRGGPEHWQHDQQGVPQGFWTHDGTVWFKDPYFARTFEVFLKKGILRTDKLQWKTFLDGTESNYFEFELNDKEFRKREVVDRKPKDWEKPKPHGIAQGGQYILRISVQPDRIETSIGQMNDRIDRKIEGLTQFNGKVALKLIQ
jgi:eukaryotic-like serine/threonine-protein kinase